MLSYYESILSIQIDIVKNHITVTRKNLLNTFQRGYHYQVSNVSFLGNDHRL